MSQSQVHQGATTMGVMPIVMRPRFGISTAAEVHTGRMSVGGTTTTIIGQPA